MKLTMHLTVKNFLSWIVGACVVGLAIIPILVATDHLGWVRWQILVVVLAVVALVALFIQNTIQSREDHERDERDKGRDKRHNETNKKLDELVIFLKESASSSKNAIQPTTVAAPIAPESAAKQGTPIGLDAVIYRVVTTGKGMAAELTRDLFRVMGREREFAIDADILVEMYVVNASTKTMFIRDFVGTVEIDGKVVTLTRQNDFYAYDFNNHHYEYCLRRGENKFDRSNLETLTNLSDSIHAELKEGKPLEGWVRFLAKDIDPEKLTNNRSYKFFIIDSLGNEHPIVKVSTTKREGEISVREIMGR